MTKQSSSPGDAEALRQMVFVSPEGRKEVLWVAADQDNRWRVLNVPVWQYGISYGTIVTGRADREDRLRFERVSEQSAGATVRAIVPKPKIARDVYHSIIQPGIVREGTGVGPATHFDPPLVAFHLHDRAAVQGKVAGYLDGLVSQGVITQWEIGDPEPESEETADEPVEERTDELVHERPPSPQQKPH
jgi:hypothetical protein